MLNKTAGVITNDGFPECFILHNALCTMHAGETMHCKPCYNNSLTPGRGSNNFEIKIFELIFLIDILINSYEIDLWRMPQHQIQDKSTLVQVMAWCRQATSHYLSQMLTQIHDAMWHL